MSDDARSLPTRDSIDIGDFILDRGASAISASPARPPRAYRQRRSIIRPLLTFVSVLLAVISACALLVLLVAPLAWREQAIAGTLLILGAILLSGLSRSAGVTMTLMVLSMFSTLRYGYWRSVETWNGVTSAGHLHQWDTVFVLLLLIAEFYAFATLALGYFQTLRPLRRPPVRLAGQPAHWPTVDVLIPTYNEPLEVVRATVLAALALDYPADKMEVVLLDDGRRNEFRDWAARVGAGYMTRSSNAHAKAGNINHALQHTTGEYVAIFDCDHVPTRSFLQMTLGWFIRDPRLGLVQTPHHFYSPDPFERNLGQFRKVPNEAALFHRLVQDGNDLWNASFFCGSCAVLRRQALDEIGGIAVETVTEDAHTALRMQRRGWNTAYINVPQAAGLATESLSAHIGQRIRWARGMVQILRTENPLFGRGLSFAQRLCYFNATTHFLFALPRLIFLTVPLTYLLFGMVNIYGYSLAVFAYALPHLGLAHVTNSRIQRGYRSSFWNEIYEAVLAPYILFPTLLALINPRLGRFNVTAKGGIVDRSYFDHLVALPFVLLLALNVTGIVMAYQRYVTDPAHHDTVIMNAIWTFYNIVILSVAASVAREKRQRRSDVRVDVHVPVTLVFADGTAIAGTSAQLSRRGATVHVSQPLWVRPNAAVTMAMNAQGSRCNIAAYVVSARQRALHLMFQRLDTAQERALVNVIYSRPEAWLHWDAGRIDSALMNFWRVVWLFLRGIVVVLVGMLTPPRARRPDRRHERERERRAAVTTFFVLLLAPLLGPGSVSAAQGGKGAQPAVAEPSMFHDAYALGDISGQQQSVLRNSGASLNFFFGVPVQKIISQATLRLRYRAPLLASNESQLELLLNGTRVGAIALAPGTDVVAEIPLPTDLLATDNALSLRLLGRCDACLRAGAPWVTVDPTSMLAIGGTRLPLANDLALLPIPFFDPASQRAWRLPIVFSDPPVPDEVKAAAIVASWFGVASDVRGVTFPVTVGQLPEGNALVVARRGSVLQSTLSIPAQPETLIAIRDNPRDPYGKLLILTGDAPEHVLEAALTLVTTDWSKRHSDIGLVRRVPVPQLDEYRAPRWLQTHEPAPVGLYTSADRLKLIGSGSISIYFRLPPDLFLGARQSVPLLLRFEYAGVTTGSQAALHVRLNGEDVDSIRLKPASQSIQREEIVHLPTGRMRPYANALTVDVDFGRSGAVDGGSQYAAILRDSSIDLRDIPHSVVLPRLELVVDAGYPFTEWPDLSRTAVVLSDAPTPREYEALLNMVGFFGAQTGSPVTGVTIMNAAGVQEMRDKDIIVLGAPAHQPLLTAWSSWMPLAVASDGLRLNPTPDTSYWLHPDRPFRDEDRGRLQGLLDRGTRLDVILQHFVSPFRPDRSVVAIVPTDADGQGIEAVFTTARTGPVYGGIAVEHSGRFESFLLGGATYHSGRLDPVQRARVFLVEHYWYVPPAVMVLALVIGRAMYDGAERVAARRLRPHGLRSHIRG